MTHSAADIPDDEEDAVPNRLPIPGIKASTFARGWPLVLVIGLALAAVALVYGSATGGLDDECTVRVQAQNAPVRAEPVPSSTVLARRTAGSEIAVSADAQRDGYWKLIGDDGWIAGTDVAATQGSRC